MAEPASEVLFWVFACAPIFGVTQVEVPTAKLFCRKRFVEESLELRTNMSISESNMYAIGSISESLKVVMP